MTKAIDFINSSEQYYKKEKVSIQTVDGQIYELVIQPKIKKSEITALINKLVIHAKYCHEQGKEYNLVIDMYAQIIKLVTDIKFNTYKDQWKQICHDVQLCLALIDLQVFEQIIEKLDKESVQQIQEAFEQYKSNFETIHQQILSQHIKDVQHGRL